METDCPNILNFKHKILYSFWFVSTMNPTQNLLIFVYLVSFFLIVPVCLVNIVTVYYPLSPLV